MSLKAELPLTQANSVSSWREEQVTTWLRKNNFGQYEQIFAENDVTGDVLLELDHQLLKELSISSVGQRVRLMAAVKHLRKSCMQEVRQSTLETQPRTASLPPRAESGEKLNRSHVHYSLPLDADRSSGAASLPYPFSEKSPSYTTAAPPNLIRHISSDSIPLGSIKQQCIRVVGEDGQFRVVNIDKALTAKGIFEKVLRKFNIKADGDKFGLFVVASDTGTARCLTDEEIVQICLSPGRPEKERLVLRKRHQPVNHDDFKRKDTIRHKFRKLENFFGEKPPRSSSQTKLGKFFGERPPSELISSNLSEYFPDHASGYLRSRFDKRRSRQETSDKGRMERTAEIDEEEDISGDDPSDSDEGVFNKDQKGPEEEEEEEEKKEDEEEEEGPPSSSTETARPKGLKWIKGALIGMGSYGNVYLGLNSLSGELMAVKQVELPTGEGANEERKRFMLDALQREIGLLKDLNHVNIVRYLGSQSDEKHLNIFLEYVPGGSVVALLANYGPFEETMVRSFVKQILAGLCYLHQQDIIHRDIKGGNILVDNKGGVKISDFGISKKVEENIMRMSTPAGAHRASLQGSIFWMAPEVVKQTHYTQKADIWSLGCLIVEMFTGEHPFPESTQMQAIFKIGQYARPHIPENVSEEATSFLEKTFDLNFQKRPTAAELQRHPFVTNIEIDT